MKESQKVFVRNLTNNEVGFKCVNFPNVYNFNPGQVLGVKFEHLEDVIYTKGFRYMLDNGILKIDPKTDNYQEVLEELQLVEKQKIFDNSLSYADAKKLFQVTPLQVNYGVIKKHLTEGTETTKKNIANAAIELQIRDYTLNGLIKKATNIDVIKTLELNSTPEKTEE